MLNKTSSVSTVILRWGQTLLKAVREVLRNMGDVFTKWSKGSSEAYRALKSIERYLVFDDKRIEGRLVSLLPPFGMMALRPASKGESSGVALACLTDFLCSTGLMIFPLSMGVILLWTARGLTARVLTAGRIMGGEA
jgi:hypothetical protein